jgi:trimethylamine--corrinoid protein Co-methyltransferase
MRILRDIGIEFLNPDAVEHLRRAGCIVNGTNVRMDEDFVMEMVARAPETSPSPPATPSAS